MTLLALFLQGVGIDPKLSIATDEYNKFHARVMIDDLLKQNLDEVLPPPLSHKPREQTKPFDPSLIPPQYVFENVAYKDNCAVPIIEESQKLAVARGLALAGKKVLIRDRAFIIHEVEREYGSLFKYQIDETVSLTTK
jgi:hypothetical protein